VNVRIPGVVVRRIVKQIVDQAVAVIDIHRAVGELADFESAQLSMAGRVVHNHAIAGLSDGRVDQPEVEINRVDAQSCVILRVARDRRKDVAA
jgi:hypothetical protein